MESPAAAAAGKEEEEEEEEAASMVEKGSVGMGGGSGGRSSWLGLHHNHHNHHHNHHHHGDGDGDDEGLYSGMTAGEIMHSLVNLHLLDSDRAIEIATALMGGGGGGFVRGNGRAAGFVRAAVLGAVRTLPFAHFCAGEDLAQASATLSHLWLRLGLQGILNFALEDAPDDASCDANLATFLATVRHTAALPAQSVSFACVKMTAICPVAVLERASALLRWKHVNAGKVRLRWEEESLPMLVEGSVSEGFFESPPEPLTEEEEGSLAGAKRRLWRLCEEAREVGVPLLVDAEYSSVQPAIDYLTYNASLAFNRHRRRSDEEAEAEAEAEAEGGDGGTLVYGTVQAYLRDAFGRLEAVVNAAARRNVPLGIKLVRGAYMVREAAEAASRGLPSPVHASLGATHECYDKCAAFLLDRAAADRARLLLATHNVDSGRAAASRALELGLVNRDPRLQFGQIKGMADGLSLSLAHAGFRVSKYLAFGPVERVVPYLIRRAEENRGVVRNTAIDRLQLRQELIRRALRLLPLRRRL